MSGSQKDKRLFLEWHCFKVLYHHGSCFSLSPSMTVKEELGFLPHLNAPSGNQNPVLCPLVRQLAGTSPSSLTPSPLLECPIKHWPLKGKSPQRSKWPSTTHQQVPFPAPAPLQAPHTISGESSVPWLGFCSLGARCGVSLCSKYSMTTS
jgi:hypothetical protein